MFQMGGLRGVPRSENPLFSVHSSDNKSEVDDEIRQVAKKAYEEGDTWSPVTRKRSLTAPLTIGRAAKGMTEAEDIAKHQSVLWECIGRRHDKSGGYIYLYKFRPEFNELNCAPGGTFSQDALDEAKRKMFPAVEQLYSELTFLLPCSEQEIQKHAQHKAELDWAWMTRKNQAAIRSTGGEEEYMQLLKQRHLDDFAEGIVLRTLGYRMFVKGVEFTLELPDRETLLANWEKLREKRLDLPPLDVATSTGVAGDLDFVISYFAHDALLSNDKEFLHDHFSHVVPAIQLMLKSGKGENLTYQKEKFRIMMLAAECFKRITIAKREISEGVLQWPEEQLKPVKDHLKKIEIALATFVDAASSASSFENSAAVTKEYMEEHVRSFNFEDRWINYLANRPEWDGAKSQEVLEKLKEGLLSNVWEELKLMEKEFDALSRGEVSVKKEVKAVPPTLFNRVLEHLANLSHHFGV